ncbi:hypothetical protein [Mycobacteroides chelonae]|uniref:hypothetical protein n=1 Tax=Mycobacteroides chelonae TaxID=1774 RepID=UPI003565E425
MINTDTAICAYGPVPVADRRIDKTDRLTPFLIPGTTDLNGPHMVAAVSELIGQTGGYSPADKFHLSRGFERYYGLSWTEAALDSAVDMDLILRINPDPEQYGDLFFCNLFKR